MYRSATVVKLTVSLALLLLAYKLTLVQLFDTQTSTPPPVLLVRNQLSSKESIRANRTKKLTEGIKKPLDSIKQGPIGNSKEEIKKPGLQVVYTSLEYCRKPTYHPQFKALCISVKSEGFARLWQRGSEKQTIKCLPNHYLLGIRKCGTTDVIKWFQYHSPNTTVVVKGDRITNQCPMEYFDRRLKPDHPKSVDLMNYSPGEILFSHIKRKNATHLVIGSTIQYIAYISDPIRSKYVLTFRNPTDRLISYLFHAHNQRWVYKHIAFKDFNATLVHQIIVGLIKKVNECLEKYGELACMYLYSSYDGNLDTVIQHGFYVVYLEELFKFIPRESVYINQLEQYSANQLPEATKIMKFFGHELNVTDAEILLTSEKKMNSGNKKEVLPETIQLLNDLYRPYNIRLAQLLEDQKWLYS